MLKMTYVSLVIPSLKIGGISHHKQKARVRNEETNS